MVKIEKVAKVVASTIPQDTANKILSALGLTRKGKKYRDFETEIAEFFNREDEDEQDDSE